MRPPKQAISPSVVRTLNRPSASGEYHGDRLRPPSPGPLRMTFAEYWNASPFRNWIGFVPSVEKRQVCRFAKPTHWASGSWSLITIDPGNALIGVRTESGQSLNTRRCSTALFGTGVAEAVVAANASAMTVRKL